MIAALLSLSFVMATAEEPKLSEAAQKELKKLEGKWKAVKAVTNGMEETPEMDGNEVMVEFKGSKANVNGKEFFLIAALDPSTDPKCIDLKSAVDQGQITKGTVFESIYKLDGEELIIAINIGGDKKRPAKFESEKDSGVVVVTMKKEKN
jgi:uncharacterized protein (TIGR03067 family)